MDNGDGTITITVVASGGSRLYDTDGNFVLKDPGHIRFAFDIDYNGTPGDPSDDTEVPDSFRIVRGSTGQQRPLGPRLLCGPGAVHELSHLHEGPEVLHRAVPGGYERVCPGIAADGVAIG